MGQRMTRRSDSISRQVRGLASPRLLPAAMREWGDTILGILYESWGDRGHRFDRAHQRVWNFDTDCERGRYIKALALAQQHLPAERWRNVLEVGCAKGVFTEQLAPVCRRLSACDISPVACAAAGERCSRFSNVRVEQFDIVEASLPEHYDVVFALDLLEAIHGKRRLEIVMERLENAVVPGGLLVLSSSRLPRSVRSSRFGKWLLEGADSHMQALARRSGLQLLECTNYPDSGELTPPGYPEHLIAVFKKASE